MLSHRALHVIPGRESGLAGRRERPGSLRVQLGLRCRGRRGCRLLGRLSFFCGGCLFDSGLGCSGLLRSSSFLRRCSGLLRSGSLLRRCGGLLRSSSFLRRCGGLLRSSSLLRGCSGLLRSGSLLRGCSGLLRSSSLLRRCSGLLHRCSGLLHRCSGLLRRCSGLLGRCSGLLGRRSGLLHSGLFGRGFFRSCHCFLLDQVAKSTSHGLCPCK